jgi:TolB-like protein/DNA-binding winged helix-turn-helix (wHTH) protein/Tfp pilus assembly protein PilF
MAAEQEPTRVFRFGLFEADLGNRQLFRNGILVGLTGQPFEVLALLLEYPGQLVTREQLRARLWPSGTVVEFDHSIAAAITKLREVLGDEAQHPRFIATVPRHGYRFIAPVSTPAPSALKMAPTSSSPPAVPTSGPALRPLRQKLDRAIIAVLAVGLAYLAVDRFWISKHVPASRPATPTTLPGTGAIAAVAEKSIAVLPFADMSEKKDQEYFADGLAEELLDFLGKTQGLHVVARTSSFSFKGKSDDIPTIAEKLKVANVLEGSVRKSGDRVRGTDGKHLWSETYDLELRDIFIVQDAIATAVVTALKLQLSPGQRSSRSRFVNTNSYLQYLLGQQYFARGSVEDLGRALGAYRQAIALDPNFAAARAGLAVAEAYLADDTGDSAGLERAQAAAERAISLAPDDALGYAARGFLRFNFAWDWSGAQADFSRALELDPNDLFVLRRYSALLTYLGRLPEGIAIARNAAELDPLSPQAWNTLAWNLIPSGDLAAAREALGYALTIDPMYGYALYNLGSIELVEHRPTEALQVFRRIPADRAGPLGWRLAGIAIAEHLLGHAKESQQALDEAIAKVSQSAAYQIAEAYAGRGEPDQAFEWLERAYRQRDGGLTGLRRDPLLISLRSDPRYKAMLKKINLPE